MHSHGYHLFPIHPLLLTGQGQVHGKAIFLIIGLMMRREQVDLMQDGNGHILFWADGGSIGLLKPAPK